ncbi:alpha/beta hydrolase [Aureispira anguillae]|uniref:Alpha/beta hydrolase n=1 Tax=Aureispira anguillae TaxID=2864201 RepID=A0A915YKI9_9BACT|nr:alpha/beta hydrolase [Aureispira anguillae]BDS14775.1 alpha/beta hydrolase [Aureispira anguillae]
MNSLYTSPKHKKEILALYQQKLEQLSIQYNSQFVETDFGTTHVIVTGAPSKPPLVLVHGSNGCAPIALEVYPNLSKQYQVFAVDVLAQPNKSAETRLSMKDQSYGLWLNQTINQLALKDVTLVGFSLGGLIILKTLIQNERNIKEVFLTAPAYIVNGNPLKLMAKVFIPMKLYLLTKKSHYLNKFLSTLFSEKDAFALQFLAKVFMHFKMDFSPVPTIKTTEAKSIETPITLIAAKQDLMFPGLKMLKRAKKIFPSLKKTILLDPSLHVQSQEMNRSIESLIMNPQNSHDEH